MTVGLPGTGIGGVFYLLSALATPLREVYRRAQGTVDLERRRLAIEVAAMAAGIVVGLWATGWLLGIALDEVRQLAPASLLAAGSGPSGNVLRVTALVLTLGTLGGVLGGVELLRLWVQRRRREDAPVPPSEPEIAPPAPRRVASSGGHRAPGRLVVLLLCVAGTSAHSALGQVAARVPAHVAGPDSGLVGTRLARADSAFKAGQRGLAAREYSLVLATDPANSRATFRLAQLLEGTSEELRLYRRYVTLEPADPWGYMAVGTALSRAGRYDEALESYGQALRLAPRERDAVLGRARVLGRAGRTDAALAVYEPWVVAHPTDTEAWKELARQRLRAGRPGDAAHALERAQALAPDRTIAERLAMIRRMAAPAITPLAGGSRDSDGNRTSRFGGALDFGPHGTWRVGLTGDHEEVRDGLTTMGLGHLAVGTTWQPRAALKIEATGGATRMDAAGGDPADAFPTGSVRVRWHGPAAGPALDLRAHRSMLDGTPLLVANRVSRAEVGAQAEVPLSGAVRLRALGRAAQIRDSADVNHRTMFGGVVACAVKPGVEVSGQFRTTRYDHASTAGYFAPALAQVIEAASYLEFESARGMLLAFDLGGGVQRIAEQGAAVGPWKPSLRLYSLIVLPLATGRDLRLEVDAENSPVASEVATAGTWRYGAATLSLRWALP